MKENKYLKWLLIIQSFLPLFFLILIRCFCLHSFKLVSQFFVRLFQKDFGVSFHFPSDENSVYVGITKGDFDAAKIIKRKRISDNVYLVYNKN